MRLTEAEQQVIESVFVATDKSVADDVRGGILHKGTSLAIFFKLRESIAKFDPPFSERLIARFTEGANP